MVARTRSEFGLVITLSDAAGALLDQRTASSPEDAPEAAATMLIGRPFLNVGDTLKVLQAK